ncbi:peptidyl-prolyl cis-trans isomerase FKBP53-like [Tasmannia lanceolata]|uniref:peptidyl-prolyl cis-trans isomerase FKBP53-like n=1 Tax=Tasmannia lanceolata TaxID=3420 RepID=UPI004062AC06
MVFWGIEIKPGTPYTHQYDETLGRLHIGQATLGSGSGSEKAKRVVVQCNVGNKSPVLICALLPEKSEWCPLNLEFEESEDVVFSVLGPKSVHLSGYYLRSHINHDGDDIDSYGEDIAETESDQSSDYDDLEDEYEDDFINDDDDDGDLGMFHASPRPNSGVKIVEIIEDEKPTNGNGTLKRLKKKNQISDSDGDDGSQKQIVIKGSIVVLESEDEDGFPISPMLKKHDVQNTEVEEETDKKTTKKGKRREKKTKDESDQVTSLKRKVDAIGQNGDSAREADQLCDSVPSSEVGAETVGKPKKKKKESAKKGKTLEDGVNSSISGTEKKSSGDQDQAFHGSESDVPIDNKAHTEGTQIDNMDNDLPVRDEPEVKLPNNKSIDDDADIQSETKKKNKKKKKKKSKNNEIDSSANGEEPGQIDEDKKELVKENEAEERPSKTRTYPNGLVVEELSMGKPDGKRASAGKKVSVHYIGKLEKNGTIFDSNIGQSPFTFRLGIGQVIKGWDVGVEGMRIGDKRRLTIPPSMGYGSKGAGKIPGNATLVFDVELVDVK